MNRFAYLQENPVKPCAIALCRICNGKPELQLNKKHERREPQNKQMQNMKYEVRMRIVKDRCAYNIDKR
jgi:hypothetical protein